MTEPSKTAAELYQERERIMARAAIKLAATAFINQKRDKVPEGLQEYWDSLDAEEWMQHLLLFKKELKTYKQKQIKELLLDLDNYIVDCKRLVSGFNRSREELLMMVAMGQLDIKEFTSTFSQLPNNREKLDRKLHKQLQLLDYEDDQALLKLDELTAKLDSPLLKKKEMEEIELAISGIDEAIKKRKILRDQIAIKLVEWKTRGTIDIASEDGKFRLDA